MHLDLSKCDVSSTGGFPLIYLIEAIIRGLGSLLLEAPKSSKALERTVEFFAE